VWAGAICAVLIFVVYWVVRLWNKHNKKLYEKWITKKEDRASYVGKDDEGKEVWLKERFRTSHVQVIGTTSAGKTESVILPSAITDIENGSGLLIIDGKSDFSFLDKLYAYVCR